MSLRLPRSVRRALARGVLALYVLPLLTPLGAELTHRAHHLVAAAQQARRQAAALGLSHEAPAPGGVADSATSGPSPALVHSHDGSTHGHGTWVAAFQRADDAGPDDGAPPTTVAPLSLHLAASRSAPPAPATVDWSPGPTLRFASASGSIPEPPPPRG